MLKKVADPYGLTLRDLFNQFFFHLEQGQSHDDATDSGHALLEFILFQTWHWDTRVDISRFKTILQNKKLLQKHIFLI